MDTGWEDIMQKTFCRFLLIYNHFGVNIFTMVLCQYCSSYQDISFQQQARLNGDTDACVAVSLNITVKHGGDGKGKMMDEVIKGILQAVSMLNYTDYAYMEDQLIKILSSTQQEHENLTI